MRKGKFLRQHIKRGLSFLLTTTLLLQMLVLPAAIPVSAVPDTFVRVVTLGNSAAHLTNTPDGQSANVLPGGDGARIANTLGDLISVIDGYFVFDVYTGGATDVTVGNDFAVLPTGMTDSWWGAGARFFTIQKESPVPAGDWTTFYVPINAGTMRTNGTSTVTIDQVMANVSQLGFNVAVNNLPPGVSPMMKNARFQSTTYSAKPIPEYVSHDGNIVDVKAPAPTNGQDAEFAISGTATAPANSNDWVTGNLVSGDYTATLTIPDGAESNYYVFARAKGNDLYTFDGVSSRINITSKTDDELITDAIAALNWDLI